MKIYTANRSKSFLTNMLIILLGLIFLPVTTLPNRDTGITEGTVPGHKIYLTTGVMIRKEIALNAPVATVWQAWTTEAGVTRFFAPSARVELAIGGRYEMLFNPAATEGMKGSEGCRILSFIPNEMISFTWNAPPSMPRVRKEHTWVVISFRELAGGKTALSLVHLGWQPGEEWEQAMRYFDRAWEIVLARLQVSLTKGPIDWKSPYTPEIKNP